MSTVEGEGETAHADTSVPGESPTAFHSAYVLNLISESSWILSVLGRRASECVHKHKQEVNLGFPQLSGSPECKILMLIFELPT